MTQQYKLRVTIALVLFCSLSSIAQQTPRFSNYLFNKMVLNPATVGMNDYVEVAAAYKKQWTGIAEAPQTIMFSGEAPIAKKQFGIGGQIVSDKLGALTNTGIVGYFAPRVRLAYDKWLSTAIGVGWFQTTLNGNELVFKDQFETILPGTVERVSVVDFKMGMYYKDDVNFVGLSIFNLIEPKISFINSDIGVQAKLYRHYYLMGGRTFFVGAIKDEETKVRNAIVPSFLFKSSENFNYQFDLNVKFVSAGIFALGVAYRTSDSFGVIAEYLHSKTIRIAYSYDFTTSSLSPYAGGSHEVIVSYRIKTTDEVKEDPRYLYN
jgi:type IX secretion system PorP/SprF family membrane protein